MALLPELWRRLMAFTRRKQMDADLEEEMRLHVELRAQQQAETGIDPDGARYAAQRQFGNALQLKETSREVWGWHWLEALAQDLRYALRTLGKSPGFTIVAILTLAIGIGASTGILSVLESQLWRPLPFPDGERLVDVHVVLRKNPRSWDVLSLPVFRAWKEQAHSFVSMAGYLYAQSRNLRANGAVERVRVMAVMPELLETLQVRVARGRAFSAEDVPPGHEHVAILTDACWRERFGADAEIVGKALALDGEPYRIIGIMPPQFRFEYMEEPAILVPIAKHPPAAELRGLEVIGRLAPGIRPEQARTELEIIRDRAMKSEGDQREDIAQVSDIREMYGNITARPLYFFAGAVGLVFLIACVNTAGLLLARGVARRREIAVRAALGARRSRLVRQLLVESLLLAASGGVAGAISGGWLARWLGILLEGNTLVRHAPITVDFRVLGLTLAVSVAAAALAGFAPAVLSSRVDLCEAFRTSVPGRTASPGNRHARSALVAAEVALGMVLLFGAGLFLSTFEHLRTAPLGFEASGSLTFRVALRGERYARPEQMRSYFGELAERIQALPGVRAVTSGSDLPLAVPGWLFTPIRAEGESTPPDGYVALEHAVMPNYLQVLGIRLLAGRGFDDRDGPASPRVAIINRTAARELFGAANPIGKMIEFVSNKRRGVEGDQPVQVVGLAENVHEFGPDEVPFDVVYLPFAQHPVNAAYFLVTAKSSGAQLATSVRSAAYEIDKDQPVFDIQTMDERIVQSLMGARANMSLVGALAVVALVLVAVGTFGTIAYFVQQRTKEFGIRVALGASRAMVFQEAIVQSLRIGCPGVLMGVIASLILGRFLRSTLYMVPHEHMGMLYGVNIYDPLVLSGTCVGLLLVLLLASYWPARRASRVEPMVALRYE